MMKTFPSIRSYLTINLAVICILIANQACFAKVRYGINVTQGNYASSRGDLVDMLINASSWSAYGGPGGAVPLTANGYPVSSPSGSACCLFSSMGYQSGTCNFYGEGDFTVQILGGGAFTLVPGTLQKKDNVTTCQFSMTASSMAFDAPPGWSVLILSNLNPNNPPNNIHLICPGPYAPYPNTQQTFTNEFLAADTPYSIVRGMCDYEATLQPPQFLAETDWNTRINPNFWGQWGQSFEATIAYCNTTMTDMWVMYPVNGTDDFSVNLANLIHKNLNPKLHAYIEYCNENWNWDYPAWQIEEAADQANTALDDVNGVWGRHAEQCMFRTMQVYKAMNPILGSQARFVVMGQAGGMPWTCAAALDWLNRNYGSPSNYIYGIGSAAYLGPAAAFTGLTGLFSAMNDYLNATVVPNLQQCRTLANQYGLKVVMYEGGQGLMPQPDLSDFNFLLSAQIDPGMGTLYAAEGAALEAAGVDEMIWTNDCQGWSQWGFWGMITDIRQAAAGTSPKWNEGIILAKAGVQSPARTASSSSNNGGSNGHNLEAQPHAHNVAPSAPQRKMMNKQEMALWAAQLSAKNAAKAQAAAKKK